MRSAVVTCALTLMLFVDCLKLAESDVGQFRDNGEHPYELQLDSSAHLTRVKRAHRSDVNRHGNSHRGNARTRKQEPVERSSEIPLIRQKRVKRAEGDPVEQVVHHVATSKSHGSSIKRQHGKPHQLELKPLVADSKLKSDLRKKHSATKSDSSTGKTTTRAGRKHTKRNENKRSNGLPQDVKELKRMELVGKVNAIKTEKARRKQMKDKRVHDPSKHRSQIGAEKWSAKAELDRDSNRSKQRLNASLHSPAAEFGRQFRRRIQRGRGMFTNNHHSSRRLTARQPGLFTNAMTRYSPTGSRRAAEAHARYRKGGSRRRNSAVTEQRKRRVLRSNKRQTSVGAEPSSSVGLSKHRPTDGAHRPTLEKKAATRRKKNLFVGTHRSHDASAHRRSGRVHRDLERVKSLQNNLLARLSKLERSRKKRHGSERLLKRHTK